VSVLECGREREVDKGGEVESECVRVRGEGERKTKRRGRDKV
jgi:hypothetical protein